MEGHTEIVRAAPNQIPALVDAMTARGGEIVRGGVAIGNGKYSRPFLRVDVAVDDKVIPVLTLYPAPDGTVMSVVAGPNTTNKIHWFYIEGISPKDASDVIGDALVMDN